MNTPRVSIVVVNWNRCTLLRECLASLQAQTFSAFEIIVVDNGSTDDSRETVAREFPAVHLLALEANHGFAGGNNAGIRAARGEFIALLNNDAVAEPTWLQELVRAMDEPRVGLCASRVIFYDRRDQLDSAGDGLSIFGTGFRRGHLQSPSQFGIAKFVFGASGSAALYRRALLDEIGLFDEDFFAVYEDVDLSFRARLAGYECAFVPNAIVYHHGWSTVGHLSDEYVFWGHRNVEYLFWKNMPTLLLGACLLPHLLYELGGFFYFALRGHGRSYWNAKRDFIRNWKQVWNKRHDVQRARRVPTREIARWLDFNSYSRLRREKFSATPSLSQSTK